MKKLKILTPALLAILLSPTVSAKTGIKAGFAFDMGLGVTALVNDQVNVMVGNDGLAVDYLFQKGGFNANVPFDWFVAAGGFHEWDGNFGARLPLGLNLNFAPSWSLYGQAAPDIHYDEPDDKFEFGVQLGLGVRYAF